MALPTAVGGLSVGLLWQDAKGRIIRSILLGSLLLPHEKTPKPSLLSRGLLIIHATNIYQAATMCQAMCWALESKEACRVSCPAVVSGFLGRTLPFLERELPLLCGLGKAGNPEPGCFLSHCPVCVTQGADHSFLRDVACQSQRERIRLL